MFRSFRVVDGAFVPVLCEYLSVVFSNQRCLNLMVLQLTLVNHNMEYCKYQGYGNLLNYWRSLNVDIRSGC